MYQCSYCKTAVMNVKAQYEIHIKSTKHIKKAFALQAPHGGIEYEEFRPKPVKKAETFQTNTEDFPQLTDDIPTSASPKTIQYGNILENFPPKPIQETNGNIKFDEVEEEYEDLTLDDVFFKETSKMNLAKNTLDKYVSQNKTAAAALNEVAVQMGWTLGFDPVPAPDNKFGVMVTIDQIDLIAGDGDNKKEARQNASLAAIKIIRTKLREEKNRLNAQAAAASKPKPNNVALSNNPNKNQKNTFQDSKKEEWPADVYCRLTIEKLLELESLSNNKFVIPRRYAAFIMTETANQMAKDGYVVAFGAGNGVLKKSKEMLEHPGFHITNFDSLVLARRSFQCFLYNQLTMLFNKSAPKNKHEKLYLTIDKEGNVKLREGCRVHLFMSHAPHGDCVESIPQNWIDPKIQLPKDLERDKKGEVKPVMSMTYDNNVYVCQPGHIRVWRGDNGGSGWVSLVECPVASDRVPADHLVMSPTDKLMSWVHLGIQGALLSHMMTPVHLYSVQVASDYMHEHFSRAILCRVPIQKLEDVVDMSKFKDPYLGRVTKLPDNVVPSPGLCKASVSYNWYSNPVTRMPEIIDNETGLVHKDSPYKLPEGDPDYLCSRLSKACMLLRLKNLFRLAVDYYALKPELQRTRTFQGIGDAAQYHYIAYKNSSRVYRSLKRCLFRSLDYYGEWAPNNGANDFDLLNYYDI